jgi:hypothetical protein
VTRAPAATETLIALSILFIAREILTSEKETPTLTRRHPWLIGVPFGLLHGLGFAGALAQIGLPTGSMLWALGAFNVGIEIGQLAAAAAVLGFLILARRIPGSAWARSSHLAYAIGTGAAYWSIERIYQVVGTS